MLHRRLTMILAWLLLAPFANSAVSEEQKWYAVEIIIFSQKTADSYDSETWPVFDDVVLSSKLVELKKPVPEASLFNPDNETNELALPEPFSMIPEDQWELKTLKQKLENSEEYEILTEKAWLQPVFKNQPGVEILIDDEESLNAYQEYTLNIVSYAQEDMANNDVSSVSSNIDSSNGDMASAAEIEFLTSISAADPIEMNWPVEAEQDPEAQEIINRPYARRELNGPPQLRTYGKVSLKMSRFLHFSVDLFYRTERPQALSIAQQAEPEFPMQNGDDPERNMSNSSESVGLASIIIEPSDFRLKESRRVKTNEIYYFDHPLFGVIAKIMPYDVPQLEEALE